MAAILCWVIYFLQPPKIYIIVYNNSKHIIKDILIKSDGVQEKIKINEIPPLGKSKIKIPKSFNETTVSISYLDYKSISHSWIIVWYLVLELDKDYIYNIN